VQICYKKVKGLRQVDFLVVGQGLAGSLLAIELIEAGQRVLVIDRETTETSSKKAAGIYNPITGRQMAKTWMADEIFPNLPAYYSRLESILQARFHYPMDIYRPFFAMEEQNDWEAKAFEPAYTPFVKALERGSLGLPHFHDPYGGLRLHLSGYVDLLVLIEAAQKWIAGKGEYRSEVFLAENLKESTEGFRYDDVVADRVIFCQGTFGDQNPYWSSLPFKLVKGEVLDMELDLQADEILNRGVFMLPQRGLFRVGSTYHHHRLDWEPSKEGRKELEDKMRKLFKGSARVVAHRAGVRPATYDRRPFVGTHPANEKVGVFNGFGSKGVSLVPFFATQYVNYLLRGGQLTPEADVKRVTRK
jgi:glycine/D-amino acid oxidase-like deaminating enzyme